MKKQLPSKSSDAKKIVAFFTVLALLGAGAMYLLLGSSESAPDTGMLPSISTDGFQEVQMVVNGLDYEPSVIPIRVGQKVRWTIDSTRAEGCARTLMSTKLGVRQMLNSGNTIIEFTPKEVGTIPFSCTMGMARGQFQVV